MKKITFMPDWFYELVVILGVLGIILFLTGCASISVESFHTLPVPLQSKTYTIKPGKGQDGPEFQTYAKLLQEQLAQYPFRMVGKGERSDLSVMFTYGISDGKNVVMSTPVYNWGPADPITGMQSYKQTGSDIDSYIVYTRTLRVVIIDNVSREIVYEGKAISTGSKQLSVVMPVLMQTLFEDFPGTSGKGWKTIKPIQFRF